MTYQLTGMSSSVPWRFSLRSNWFQSINSQEKNLSLPVIPGGFFVPLALFAFWALVGNILPDTFRSHCWDHSILGISMRYSQISMLRN
jgi:hypothetical protein